MTRRHSPAHPELVGCDNSVPSTQDGPVAMRRMTAERTTMLLWMYLSVVS